MLVLRREELCGSNTYTTTLHCINSAILKLGKLMTAGKVYRGVAKGVLPPEFWKPNALRFRGGVEYAFLSATRDREARLLACGM